MLKKANQIRQKLFSCSAILRIPYLRRFYTKPIAYHSAFTPSKYYQIKKPPPKLSLSDLKKYDGERCVLIFGLPRAGNNWLTSLIADCLHFPHPNAVRYVHTNLDRTSFRRDPRILRATCLLRDIRDVIVSMYHYHKTPGFESFPGFVFDNIEDFYYEFFLNYFSKLPRWAPWEKNIDDYVAYGLPLVKYERLYDNASRELERLFNRWNITVPKEIIEKAVEGNSLEKFKSGQKRVRFDPDKPLIHFRKGGYGNYLEEFSEHLLKDVNLRYGDYLRKWGYKV